MPELVTIESHAKVGAAIDLMQRYSISQLPVVRDGDTESLADVVGSLQERGVLDRVFKNPDALNEDVAVAMQPPLAAVDVPHSLDQVFADLSGPSAAVVVAAGGRPAAILTGPICWSTSRISASQVNGGLAARRLLARTATKTRADDQRRRRARPPASAARRGAARRARSRRAGSRTGA